MFINPLEHTRLAKYELKFTSDEFKSTRYELKSMSSQFNSGSRVQFTNYEFGGTSFVTKSTYCKIKSTSYDIKARVEAIIPRV